MPHCPKATKTESLHDDFRAAMTALEELCHECEGWWTTQSPTQATYDNSFNVLRALCEKHGWKSMKEAASEPSAEHEEEGLEARLLTALGGHANSKLWGEAGLVEATMRTARIAMDAEPGIIDGFDRAEKTIQVKMEDMPSVSIGQPVHVCL